MKLIKDLGLRITGIDKRYNKPRRGRYGLFECPICKRRYESQMAKGKEAINCKECRGLVRASKGHGMANEPVYQTWQNMRQRCNNPKNKKYHIYGGKGITVSSDWDTFQGFWDDMQEGYVKGMTIDRIDSDKNYCKENCQWLTKADNSAKTCNVKPVTQYRKVKGGELRFIKNWDSAKQAADELELTAAHITVVCKGRRKTHGGFAWAYTNINMSPDTNMGKELS